MLFRSVSQSRYVVCPNSVISQCFILLLVSFLHLSKNRLTAKVATALLSWIFISLHNLSNSSSLNVSVINLPLLTFNSSFSLTCHSLFFVFYILYNSHNRPAQIIPCHRLRLVHFPRFFCLPHTFYFLSILGISTYPFFYYLLYTFLAVLYLLISYQRTGGCPFNFSALWNVPP